MKRKLNPFVVIILGLALFGIVHQLIFNTVQFLSLVIITGGIILVLFLLYRNFMRNKYNTPKSKSPTQPTLVKRNSSNVIPHRNMQKSNRVKRQRPLNRRGSTPNLTVIEGKKGKKQKKNRALF